ncbi:zinc metalloprotease [Mucilaginibacter calamicampi]|uniref:Zinc metalloprotease n=1 Tax=Mucilaginibacter calamicampi TaxID=1302352 RepID=A0ABW2YUJ2_9SPHI
MLNLINYQKRLVRYLTFLILIVVSCSKGEHSPAPDPVAEEEIIKIPVVVHVIYSEDQFNISDDKIRSQIKVLNEDFRMRNPDHLRVPDEYKSVAADVGIDFQLASIDPEGNPTNGITRTRSILMGWHGRVTAQADTLEKLPLYHTNKGGHDAWPRDKYLNIWIADLSDRNGNVIIAGYSQFPGAPAAADGVVIDPRCFGTLPPLTPQQSLGRTATHEIGHWLNLYHIYAQPSDDVDDTPPGCQPNLSRLSALSIKCVTEGALPLKTNSPSSADCGPSPMTMNFMDYVSDENMYMFTRGQKERMRSLFKKSGAREALYRNNTLIIKN